MSKPMPTKVIGGFRCEMEPNEDREGMNCWVFKGPYSGSLAFLWGEGCLHNDNDRDADEFLAVNPATIDAIHEWAASNGY